VHEVRKRPILGYFIDSRSDLKPAIWDEVARIISHFGEGTLNYDSLQVVNVAIFCYKPYVIYFDTQIFCSM
jgi:hypothetical protein